MVDMTLQIPTLTPRFDYLGRNVIFENHHNEPIFINTNFMNQIQKEIAKLISIMFTQYNLQLIEHKINSMLRIGYFYNLCGYSPVGLGRQVVKINPMEVQNANSGRK